ncbi:MAG: hypothetical protein OEW49_05595 [Nitrosopumilus sp.]|nr:hypothetical protein [Nitrosopumilus sp.]
MKSIPNNVMISNLLILDNIAKNMLKKFYVWMGISVAALVVGLVLLFG